MSSTTPNEITLNFINSLKDQLRHAEVSHIVSGDGVESGFSQGSSSHQDEEIGFPAGQSFGHTIKDEVKIPRGWVLV